MHNGERNGKMIRNPYPGPDHNQKLTASMRVTPCPCLRCLVDVRYRDCELSCSRNDRRTE